VIAQEITNTYGTPRYQEVNPSIVTTVTFPFFFGVMFGDIAHGGALLAFAIFLVFSNEKVKRSSLKMFSSLRYMILMMGFFAIFCGFIYNDFMGMNMNIFGSCYNI
jgi:V-type H+-transporting ATPase subunit a